MVSDEMLQQIIGGSMAFLVIAACFGLYRMIRGPQLTDRVVALDLIGMILLGFVMVNAAYWDNPVFLDASIILALVGFLATVGISRYLERRRVE